MLSISFNKEIAGNLHREFYVIENRLTIENFSGVICKNIWSPIVWKNGRRASKNFVSCAYMVLDFDSGEWTIEKTIAWLKEKKYAAILGTSKSHQKEKRSSQGLVQPACDRFRLVLPFEHNITDRVLYEHQMKSVMREIPCDPSCKDGGRFFYPCREIVYAEPGVKVTVEGLDEGHRIYETSNESHESIYGEHGSMVIPSYILSMLEYGVPPGRRHVSIYAIAAELKKTGYVPGQIMALIENAHESLSKAYAREDIERTVRDGWAKNN